MSFEQNDDYSERDAHIREIGYVRLDPIVTEALARHGPWLEVGAGSGALAEAVRAKGGRVVATDNYSWNGPISVGSAGPVYRYDGATAARRFLRRRNSVGLLISWPYVEPWARRAADFLAVGQKLAYIGEPPGGCTADESFFELVDSDFELVESVALRQWCWIYDSLKIYWRVREVWRRS